MTGSITPGQPPAPELRLRSTIDAGEIARLDAELNALFHQRLLVHRARFVKPRPINPLAVKVGKWASLTGLAITLAISSAGGLPYGGYRLDIGFAAFFMATLAASFMLPLLMSWIQAPWPAYWRYLAKSRTDGMLKKARASVPFEAQYDFQGDTVVYIRTTGGAAKTEWKRPLAGLRLSGKGYTLLYKNSVSLTPSAIFLHQPNDGLEALLDRHGVKPLPPSSPAAL